MILRSGSQARPLACLHFEFDKTGPAQSAVTIMIVEDDERARWVTARMLRDEGYNVIEAHSGEQALERLADAREVQLVLTDLAMPGMHGLELAENVVAAAPWRRVVLMSGYDTLIPKPGTPGARFPLLMKPFSAHQLTSQIREVLPGSMH
jgi:DNA-binding NtrC family response regulator